MEWVSVLDNVMSAAKLLNESLHGKLARKLREELKTVHYEEGALYCCQEIFRDAYVNGGVIRGAEPKEKNAMEYFEYLKLRGIMFKVAKVDTSRFQVHYKISNELKVSKEFFLSLDKKINLSSIVEQSRASYLVEIEGKQYCLSGALGTGKGSGWAEMYAYQAVPIAHYKEEKKPLSYNKHFREVNAEKRERGYDGLLVEHNKSNYVLVGPEMRIIPQTTK